MNWSELPTVALNQVFEFGSPFSYLSGGRLVCKAWAEPDARWQGSEWEQPFMSSYTVERDEARLAARERFDILCSGDCIQKKKIVLLYLVGTCWRALGNRQLAHDFLIRACRLQRTRLFTPDNDLVESLEMAKLDIALASCNAFESSAMDADCQQLLAEAVRRLDQGRGLLRGEKELMRLADLAEASSLFGHLSHHDRNHHRAAHWFEQSVQLHLQAKALVVREDSIQCSFEALVATLCQLGSESDFLLQANEFSLSRGNVRNLLTGIKSVFVHVEVRPECDPSLLGRAKAMRLLIQNNLLVDFDFDSGQDETATATWEADLASTFGPRHFVTGVMLRNLALGPAWDLEPKLAARLLLESVDVFAQHYCRASARDLFVDRSLLATIEPDLRADLRARLRELAVALWRAGEDFQADLFEPEMLARVHTRKFHFQVAALGFVLPSEKDKWFP